MARQHKTRDSAEDPKRQQRRYRLYGAVGLSRHRLRWCFLLRDRGAFLTAPRYIRSLELSPFNTKPDENLYCELDPSTILAAGLASWAPIAAVYGGILQPKPLKLRRREAYKLGALRGRSWQSPWQTPTPAAPNPMGLALLPRPSWSSYLTTIVPSMR